MNCPKCDKVVPITREIKPADDAVSCAYCGEIIPSETMTWSDGKFHFNILGDVPNLNLEFGPRILLPDQRASTLDIRKILDTAKRHIRSKPNINCVCGEFGIKDSDIRLELLMEETE